MGVCNVHRRQILAALGKPIQEFPRMFHREKCIDEDRVALAKNERDRIGNPGEIFFAGRESLGGAYRASSSAASNPASTYRFLSERPQLQA